MREIKFRGKRVDNGEWVYGCLTGTDTIHTQPPFVFEGTYEYWGHEVIPETVGQYTGRKDKNGKEIYENDVLKINTVVNVLDDLFGEDESFDQEIRCEVLFSEEFACFELKTIEEDLHLKTWGFYGKEDSSTIEIIGNTHEK